jgi:hypothetical protein
MLLNSLKLSPTSFATVVKRLLAQHTSDSGLLFTTNKSTLTTTSSSTLGTSQMLSKSIGETDEEQHAIEAVVTKRIIDFGLLFDIDGVLMRGKTLLPSTRDCVKLITDKAGRFRVPTVFVTNAGSQLRASKAAKLSNLLGVYIAPEQMVMSHSPLKMLRNFHDKRCLISGQGPIVEIAKNLGFKNVITIDDVRKYHPQLDVVDHKRRNFAVSFFLCHHCIQIR